MADILSKSALPLSLRADLSSEKSCKSAVQSNCGFTSIEITVDILAEPDTGPCISLLMS